MRTWILLALLGLVLLVSMTYREGVDSTLAPTPTCPPGSTSQGNGMCIKLTGVSPDSNNHCPSGFDGEDRLDGPYTFDGEFKQFDGKCIKYMKATCPSGYLVDASAGLKCITNPHASPIGPTNPITGSTIEKCNTFWNISIERWARGQLGAPEAPGDPDCMPYAPSWIRELSDAGNLLVSSTSLPTAATKAQAIIEQKQATDYAAETGKVKSYAESTGYAAIDAAIKDGNYGPLPPPIDESADSDIGAVRPGGGTVYTDSNSPFSGRPGTGQGLGSNIPPSSNTYGSGAGYSSTTVARNTGLASGPTVIKPSTKVDLQVGGPKYGGLGAPISSSNSGASYTTGPILYGPKAAQNKNIDTTNWMPSYSSAGSDWTNMFAGTSRVPGDQDLIPNPYLQSSAYSLANGSQKTNPVPFLSDFSAFQS